MPPSTTATTHLTPIIFAGWLYSGIAAAAEFTVADVTFDSDWATTTAEVTGGGYSTSFDAPYNRALPSSTSADWEVGNSLGTAFQRPSFQPGYSAGAVQTGDAGTAATLGQDPDFPDTSNEREIIQLGWGDGNGLTEGNGYDLAIFEQATSEAFALRVHLTGTTPAWSAWYYIPDDNVYDADADATPTRIDLSADLGLGAGIVINALEITNLIVGDVVADQIDATGFGRGEVTFAEDDPQGGFAPGRWSSSGGVWKGFEAGKYDPDIQYVVALRALTPNVSDSVTSTTTTTLFSQPARLAAAGGPLPLPGGGPLLFIGLAAMAWSRRLLPPRWQDAPA